MKNVDGQWKNARVNKISGEFILQDSHVSGGDGSCNPLRKYKVRAIRL